MALLCDYGDDNGGDRALPRIARYRGKGELNPKPPYGWIGVVGYDTSQTPEPNEVASWVTALRYAQHWSRKAGSCHHMVCREHGGTRVLLVHPDMKAFASDLVESMNDSIMYCTCGGDNCFESSGHQKAMLTFAKRRWKQLSIPQRLTLYQELEWAGSDVRPDIVLYDSNGLNGFDDTGLYYRIASFT